MNGYGDRGSSLRDLPWLRSSRRRRVSSWDRSGGNDDRIHVAPGQVAALAELPGAGCINHIWMTVAAPDGTAAPEMREAGVLRKLLLAMYWDGETEPSVLVPLGDFFGAGHARTRNFASMPLQMSAEDGRALNCFFHMPFSAGARLELRSEMSEEEVLFYYHIDYEEYDALEDGLGRFHAQWRRQNPTIGGFNDVRAGEMPGVVNLDGADNYVLLDAQGRGHYVGCVLNVHNLGDAGPDNWYGEGDDMIFIDGEQWPPSLHGTGTEDYFNTAWCPQQEFSAPYHGITAGGGPHWSGQVSLYRFHVEDPVTFERSIRVTLERGHANQRADDWSSVAYWYQAEPHRPFEILPVTERLPRPL